MNEESNKRAKKCDQNALHQQNEDKTNINSDEISFGKNCLLFNIAIKPKSKSNEGEKKTNIEHWTHIKQLPVSVSSTKHEVKFTWKIYNGLNKTQYGKRARAKWYTITKVCCSGIFPAFYFIHLLLKQFYSYCGSTVRVACTISMFVVFRWLPYFDMCVSFSFILAKSWQSTKNINKSQNVFSSL